MPKLKVDNLAVADAQQFRFSDHNKGSIETYYFGFLYKTDKTGEIKPITVWHDDSTDENTVTVSWIDKNNKIHHQQFDLTKMQRKSVVNEIIQSNPDLNDLINVTKKRFERQMHEISRELSTILEKTKDSDKLVIDYGMVRSFASQELSDKDPGDIIIYPKQTDNMNTSDEKLYVTAAYKDTRDKIHKIDYEIIKKGNDYVIQNMKSKERVDSITADMNKHTKDIKVQLETWESKKKNLRNTEIEVVKSILNVIDSKIPVEKKTLPKQSVPTNKQANPKIESIIKLRDTLKNGRTFFDTGLDRKAKDFGIEVTVAERIDSRDISPLKEALRAVIEQSKARHGEKSLLSSITKSNTEKLAETALKNIEKLENLNKKESHKSRNDTPKPLKHKKF